MRPDNLNEKPDRLSRFDTLNRRLHSPDGTPTEESLHQTLDLLAEKIDHLNDLITEATPTESQSILIDEEADEG
jgi:hypothetical protein